MAHEAIYETVFKIIRQFEPGTILDIPAGEGALAARLIENEFDVRCCDLYPEIFKLVGTEIRKGDLSNRLDYPDSAFGTIVCVEGLEHIENPQQAIREFARILKSGGNLIVSVPNILNIEERLKWLFFGYTSHFKPLSSEYLAREIGPFGERPEIALHINPIGYSELRFSLERSGFRVVKIYRDKPKANLWLYWPIVMFIRLLNRVTTSPKRQERWSDDLQSNEVLLGGNTLIVHAEKVRT
jgi:ubiquinone/menaquinone biosynthesis C-methylase UbiE